MHTAQTAFSSLEKRDLSVQNRPRLRPSSLAPAPPPPLGKASHPAPDIQSWLSSCVTCSCPGNNIAQALGTSTSHSQAAFRDICQGGVCQASLILARAGSQQDCVGCKSWSSVLSLVCLPPPLSPPPSSLWLLNIYLRSTRLHWYSAGVLAKGEIAKAFTGGEGGLRKAPSGLEWHPGGSKPETCRISIAES